MSALENDSGYITNSAGAFSYANLEGKPDAVSAFTNDVGYVSGDDVSDVWTGTKQEYLAIPNKNDNTLYFVIDE